jgi:hypothetical protein
VEFFEGLERFLLRVPVSSRALCLGKSVPGTVDL